MMTDSGQTALLTICQMYAADQAAMAAGISGTRLMEAAGQAIAAAVSTLAEDRPCPIFVLCGPGNNGGDGFVAARLLAAAGWPVRLALLGPSDALKGDAAWASSLWQGAVETADPAAMPKEGILVDALFGAGLSRPLEGRAAALVQAMAASGLPVLAVDVPSGINGDTGQVMGVAAPARSTVTFFRRKPGHLLLPGRYYCGDVALADIGIPDRVLEGLAPDCYANDPPLWAAHYPWPRLDGHKYDRGHLLLLGGTQMTGAARLAARAALRAGAGLATLACAPAAVMLYSMAMPSLIVSPLTTNACFAALLSDHRRNAVLLGPGAGMAGEAGALLHQAVLAALASGRCGVLDADIFSVFAGELELLKAAGLDAHWVLTPHEGEFHRLFGAVAGASRLEQARSAARQSGAVILLKGADTVIAHPDGRAAINHNAPPDLATAGSGDVLAGLIAGLLAQGMPAFEAACAGAWLHGESGMEAGSGLIAEDLSECLPAVLRRLRSRIDSSSLP